MALDLILGSDFLDINDLEKNISKRIKKIDNEALEKLEIINKESQIERENRLLKESIALSHEELRKFQKDHKLQIDNMKNTINKLENKINQLQDSNNLISESIAHEVNTLSTKIDVLLVSKVKTLSKVNKEYVEELKELTNKSKERFESFYNKKKLIDRLIFVNLGITPALFLILVFFIFFKKYL